MPAPKQFNPGPQTIRDEPVSRTVVTKGRHAVVAPQEPVIDDPSVVEIAVDDVTVVLRGASKYTQRSFHAYGEIGDAADTEPAEAAEAVMEPVPSTLPTFGEWRSDSTLTGTHYHRKDSRRI